MDKISSTSQADGKDAARKRNLIILGSLIPVAALFALLGWAVARSDGNPGGFGINSGFGEIPVERRAAPEFTRPGLDGGTISLSGLRGKVVMLDFWSSWCPPCRREAPVLAQVYREYQGRNVEFVGVAVWDDGQDVLRYVREYDLPYPNVLDDKGRVAIDYGVAGIPEKYFIDESGNVVRSFVGPMEPGSLRAILDGLLAP